MSYLSRLTRQCDLKHLGSGQPLGLVGGRRGRRVHLRARGGALSWSDFISSNGWVTLMIPAARRSAASTPAVIRKTIHGLRYS